MITLEEIKSQQDKVAELIARYEAQTKEARYIDIPAQRIALMPGERYAGILFGKDGTPDQHIILLSESFESVDWDEAMVHAHGIGGSLPTRREQALLFANLPEQFERGWYWSCERHASDADYAWMQDFGGGYQGYYHKGSHCRARVVRRVSI